MSATITMKDVLAAMDALRASLARHEAKVLQFEHSLYWEVPLEEMDVSLGAYPEKLDVGDLEDDVSHIREFYFAEGAPEMYAEKLAAVLRYIGTRELGEPADD